MGGSGVKYHQTIIRVITFPIQRMQFLKIPEIPQPQKKITNIQFFAWSFCFIPPKKFGPMTISWPPETTPQPSTATATATNHLGSKMLNFLILQAIRDLDATARSKMLHKGHKGAFFWLHKPTQDPWKPGIVFSLKTWKETNFNGKLYLSNIDFQGWTVSFWECRYTVYFFIYSLWNGATWWIIATK